ncbi:MAG: bifunctional demethylmenaquinone methyltransferase/2-methoxy-6-polyprenyl-1,4-benzoquinol methylase UbiE [Persicimonas sp.]
MSEQVHEMFTRVAPRYDTVNTVLSLGIHHLWRKWTVAHSGVEPGDAVLDCAAGTGDLAFTFADTVGPDGRVVASDFNQAMLAYGQQKAAERDLPLEVEWDVEDVTQMSYDDDTFDVASIAFGIRNVPGPAKGLAEMARVVRPGGSVVVLEFGQPSGLMKPFYNIYNRHVVPLVGGLLSGQHDAYRYLHETSSEFPCGDDFVELMDSTGRFERIENRRFTGGIAHFYRGVVA